MRIISLDAFSSPFHIREFKNFHTIQYTNLGSRQLINFRHKCCVKIIDLILSDYLTCLVLYLIFIRLEHCINKTILNMIHT